MGRATLVVAAVTRDRIVDIDDCGHQAELAEFVSDSSVEILRAIFLKGKMFGILSVIFTVTVPVERQERHEGGEDENVHEIPRDPTNDQPSLVRPSAVGSVTQGVEERQLQRPLGAHDRVSRRRSALYRQSDGLAAGLYSWNRTDRRRSSVGIVTP